MPCDLLRHSAVELIDAIDRLRLLYKKLAVHDALHEANIRRAMSLLLSSLADLMLELSLSLDDEIRHHDFGMEPTNREQAIAALESFVNDSKAFLMSANTTNVPSKCVEHRAVTLSQALNEDSD